MYFIRISLLTLLALFLLAAIGCSTGGDNPAIPQDPNNMGSSQLSGNAADTGRVLWGAWQFGIDPVAGTVDVIPNRTLAAHFNVKPYLMPPACSDCMKVKLIGIVSTNTYAIKVTLKNPTAITGYDVRGTVFNTGVMELRNPDSYTLILANPGDTSPNPFRTFAKEVPDRSFPGGASHLETFNIFNLYHPDYSLIDFIVDASWPGHCKEPYEVNNVSTTGVFQGDGSNAADIMCDVLDWQDDVQIVKVDLTSLGGDANTQMTNIGGATYAVQNVSWATGGQGAGTYKALITARTTGTQSIRETYNYVSIVIGGASSGIFKNELANFVLTGEDAPTDVLDLAVIGDDAGSSMTMVVGADHAYHTWDATYTTSAGYVGLTTPFDNMLRFDTASLTYPDDLTTWAWMEVNDDPDPLDPTGVEPQSKPISWWVWIYWWDTTPAPVVSGWIFYSNPDQAPPIDTYTEAFDACGGFARDGLQYWASYYVNGDETLYPYVGVYGFVNPYNDVNSWAFLGYAPEGSGDGFVSRAAVNSVDVDDMEGMTEVYSVFAEGAPENAVEVYQYNFEQANIDGVFDMTAFATIHPTSEPIDVEILPMKNLAQDSDWICVLTANNIVEVYKVSDGSLVTTFGDAGTIAGEARYLDVDDLNYKVHIMQDGPQISVFYYAP